jgi:alpha-glucosidase
MAFSQKPYNLASPDNRIKITVSVTDSIRWFVYFKGELLITPSVLALNIEGKTGLGVNASIRNIEKRSVNSVITALIPVKARNIPNGFNELKIRFKNDYYIAFRAYNDGVAYRFETFFKDTGVEVTNETVRFNFPQNNHVFWGEEKNKEFQSHFELLFKDTTIAAFSKDAHAGLPLWMETPSGVKMLFTESDLYDYPNLFFFGTSGNAITGGFPKVILEKERMGDRGIKINKLAGYIAHTKGVRTYPWRCVIIEPDDKGLLENNLVYKLASPNVLDRTDWIKPGKVAWDWWNANNIYGVDFRSGLNTQTYKYYIDFASAYQIEYIILDEGWSRTTMDLSHSKDSIDLQELIHYGKSKNVGLILWTLWEPLDEHLEEILDLYQNWGVKGIKVDFMARADQYMVNYYERVAAAAAKRHLLVDLHGAYKPVGLNRKYPNVLSYEGVRGLENCKWSDDEVTPKHDLTLPFTRMAVGPMDYTPGAMMNAAKGNFHISFTEPMSQGTRAHQVAMYVVYESPLQMLADNPSNYLKDTSCTRFITQIPTIWDTTIALQAKTGEYLAVAKRNGNEWYIGAMTNWNKRTLEIPLSFLDDKDYSAQILEDGVNADKHGSDYHLYKKRVKATDTLFVNMQPGGGYCAILSGW